MKERLFSGIWLAIILSLGVPAEARDRRRPEASWWRGTCHEQFLADPCEVKLEAKRGEYKREIKCQDGVGAFWERGEWKEEYRDGSCLVKIEAKRDEYKEHVQCD
jgi:hypothetical protein